MPPKRMFKEICGRSDVKNRLTNTARGLRRRQTDVEAKLWAKLRNRRLDGVKFRRQVPRGPYIVDFLCDGAMLIVELDGSQHSEVFKVVSDEARSAYLASLGYCVVRFWNADINRDLDGVLETIYATAAARVNTPSSGLRPPAPQGEKGRAANLPIVTVSCQGERQLNRTEGEWGSNGAQED